MSTLKNTPFLIRPNISARQFPAIAEEMYNAPEHPVLQLINTPISFLARYRPKPSNTPQAITRLLLLHRAAMNAENKGLIVGVDDLWELLRDEAHELFAQTALWDAFGGKSVREAFIAEVLADTHLAYYNAYIDTPSGKPRAEVHRRFAYPYLLLLGMKESEINQMPQIANQHALYSAWERNDWEMVLSLCDTLLKGNTNQRLYLQMGVKASAQLLRKSDPKPNAIPLATLESAVRFVEQARKQRLTYAPYYDQLGVLYHLLAIAQFNTGQMAVAMENEYRALAYLPNFPAATQTLASMDAESKKIEAQLNQAQMQRGRVLSSQAQVLRYQVNSIKTVATRFQTSEEARSIVQNRRIAHGQTAWERMKLSPSTADAASVYALLGDQLDALASANTPMLMIPIKWQATLTQYPALAPVTSSHLMLYIQTYLMNSEPPDDTPLELPKLTDLGALQKLKLTPAMISQRQRGQKHIGYWMFSKQGTVFRGMVAVAVVALLIALGVQTYAGVTARQQQMQIEQLATRRQTAYDALIASVNAGDTLAGMDAAEEFFRHPPLTGEDNRSDQVTSLYNELLVAWIAREAPPPELITERVNVINRLQGE